MRWWRIQKLELFHKCHDHVAFPAVLEPEVKQISAGWYVNADRNDTIIYTTFKTRCNKDWAGTILLTLYIESNLFIPLRDEVQLLIIPWTIQANMFLMYSSYTVTEAINEGNQCHDTL